MKLVVIEGAGKVKTVEKYLGKGSIDIVIANNELISSDLAKKYRTEEQKDPVVLDMHELDNKNIYVIQDKLFTIEDGWYRHDALKTGYLLFSYLMDGRK